MHAVATPREDRLGRLRDRLRRVGDRRQLGRDRRGGVPGGDARRGRRRRDVLRHGGRLRGRALGAPDRAAAAGARGAARGRDQVRTARGAGSGAATPTRTFAAGSSAPARTWASRPSTSCSCTARRGRRTTCPRCTRPASRLVQEGLVRAYGVSVEKVEEGLKAIEFDGVATIQLIFNMLRQRPAELFFDQARRRDVGVIVRVPLASGLLTGKFDRNSDVRGRGSPRVQPPRRAVRRRRDLLRGRLRGRARGGGGAQAARASGCDAGPARAALDPHVRRRLDGHPRARRRRSRPVRTPLPPTCPRRSPETMERIAEIYRRRVAPLVHQRW